MGPCVVLALFPQRLIHEAALFSLGRQAAAAAQVGLISKHDEKFGLLAIGSVFNHPRRDLEVEHVVLNVLAGRTRGADPHYTAMVAAMNKPRQKTIRSRDAAARYGYLAIVRGSRLL